MTDAERLEACIRSGGVAVFPADTVYGLACDPADEAAIARLYALKGRPAAKPSAVMWFAVEPALAALPALGPRTRAAVERLLPGPVTVLLPDPASDGALGLRVPDIPSLAAVGVPVLQSSANLASGPDARRLDEVPASIREGADLVLDGGELPGTPSTVVDLRPLEAGGEPLIVRPGALATADVLVRLR